jgi:formylglycine-generating enzyme required for sulfatase activity
MQRIGWLVISLLVAMLGIVPAALAHKRVALVIGNSAYQHTPKLTNPKNDATDMAAQLKKLGFQVVEGYDLDKAAFDRKVYDFALALRGADAGVLFYAGHGLQVLGRNYLVPVNAKAEAEELLDFERVRVDVVQRAMELTSKTNVLFLDACRDNPLARNLARSMGTRSTSVGNGLGAIEAGIGTLISFSTHPGAVASDGTGRNSPYTAALVKYIGSPGDDLNAILINVRKDVRKDTQGKQVPWEHSSLEGRFYFNAAGQADEERGLKAKDAFKECDECPEMTVVPAGEFMMGSPAGEEGRYDNEGQQRKVVIAKAFAVGKFEVTFAEWDACVAAGGCKHKPEDQGWGRGKRPVINVSWDDITKEYLPWLSRKTGKSYRLLSEAEWEYAARAGTTTPFSTGRTITPEQANFNGDSTYGGSAKGVYRQKTVEVGTFPANTFGLHDMHGNVWEWVADCYKDSYAGAPADGSAVTSGDCGSRVLRGGCWDYIPRNLRSADRDRDPSGSRNSIYGFRVARTLGP